MSTSETPRTDAVVAAGYTYQCGRYVLADFARQLERELSAEKYDHAWALLEVKRLNAELTSARSQIDSFAKVMAELQQDRDAARPDPFNVRGWRINEPDHAERLERELAAARADSERLDWLLSPENRGHDEMGIAVFHKRRGAGWITDRAAIDAARAGGGK